MANEILIDGWRLAWPEFADSLTTLRDALANDPRVGYVRAPRQCRAQAARLITDLDLGECITLFDEHPASARRLASAPAPAPAWRGTGEPVLAMLRNLLRALRQLPLHD